MVSGTGCCQSVVPAVEWETTFGGNNSDAAYSIAPADDGGYLAAGATRSFGNGGWDAYLVRFNATGAKMWEKTYGGSGGEWCYNLKRLSDGNYVLVGATSSNSKGGFDVYVLKVDPAGNQIWNRTYGGSTNDAGFSCYETMDGGLIITGYFGTSAGYSRAALIKQDRNGNSEWDRGFGNSTTNWGKSIIQTSDGGYAIAGWRNPGSHGKADMFVTRTDSNGTLLWEKDLGGAGDDLGYGIAEAADGGLIIVGHTTSFGSGNNDIYVVRTDLSGTELWNRTYGGAADDYGGMSISLADGYVFVGSTASSGTFNKIFLVRTDLAGNEQWNESYGIESMNASGGSGIRNPDGSYVLVGNTNEYASGNDDALIIKLTGNSPGTPAPDDLQQKATMAVAAVVVGTGLGLLGVLIGRIIDSVVAMLVKILSGMYSYLAGILPVDMVVEFFYGLAKTYGKSMMFRKLGQLKEDKARITVPFIAGFSSRELLVILISSVLLGIAFIISKKLNLLSPDNLVLYIVMAGFVVIMHDLSHRYFAHKYKSVVEYKFWGIGTVIMFATAFIFGLVYAVPARTIINDAKKMSKTEQAVVYFAGPAMSAGLAIAFLLLVPTGGLIAKIALLGVSMNLLSAVYSLLPVDPLDGKKVYDWKKLPWAGIFIPLMIIYIVAAIYIM